MRLQAALVAVALAALAAPAAADNTRLNGTVGPDYVISLVDTNGSKVTQLAAGTYDFHVVDLSPSHNFHLIGPGVDRLTPLPENGTFDWTVTVTAGNYIFFCDAHSDMVGDFTVTGAATTTTTTTQTTTTTTTTTAKPPPKAKPKPKPKPKPKAKPKKKKK